MKKSLKLLTIFVLNFLAVANAQQNFNAGDVLPGTANVVSYNKWNPENKTLKIVDDSKGVKVLWKTFSTMNARYFELQRADGSNDFVTIKQVRANAAEGRNNYDLGFRQSAIVEQMVTYRLKLVFDDGTVDYSDVAFVKKEEANGAKGYLMIIR